MFDIYSANEWSTKKRKDFLCDQLKNWPSLFNFLNQKDFCCMPLPNIYPTMNYDPTEGGLFFYSLEVARTLQNLTTHMSLTWKREESPLLIGLLHAIWILDDYYCVPFGDSQEQLGLLRNESPIYPPGYGDKSLILLMNHIDLTEEEKLCIPYHRGSFTEMQYWKYYCKAIKKNQNVLFTHTAICSVIF